MPNWDSNETVHKFHVLRRQVNRDFRKPVYVCLTVEVPRANA